MAVIQHKDPDVHSIGHDGVEYPTQGEGLFEVPHDVAVQLVKFPNFRLYDGLPWPREKSARELEDERIANIAAQAAASLQQPAPAKSSRPKRPTTKRPAKKKAAAKSE